MLPTSEGPPARRRRQPAPLTPPEACKAVPHQVRGLDGQIRRTGTLWSRFVGVTDGAGRAQHADLKRQQQDRPGDPAGVVITAIANAATRATTSIEAPLSTGRSYRRPGPITVCLMFSPPCLTHPRTGAAVRLCPIL
jgi:hypothetical protein